MQKINVKFQNQDGEELSGILDMPLSAPRAFALFAHCFTCSKESRAARYVSTALAEQGIATLRFDFTGLGQSEGEPGAHPFARDVDDIVAAAKSALDKARLARSRTVITAPFDALVTEEMVDVGQVVGPGDESHQRVGHRLDQQRSQALGGEQREPSRGQEPGQPEQGEGGEEDAVGAPLPEARPDHHGSPPQLRRPKREAAIAPDQRWLDRPADRRSTTSASEPSRRRLLPPPRSEREPPQTRQGLQRDDQPSPERRTPPARGPRVEVRIAPRR